MQIFKKNRPCLIFEPKMPKMSKLEISTFELVYMPIFTKNRPFLIFGPKMPKMSNLGTKLHVLDIEFEISTFELV